MAERLLPTRTASYTDDEAVPDGDPSDTTGLLLERLRAWKHMCGFLEDYIKAVSKEQTRNAKETEKVLKTVSNPLREGHHFDQSIGGIAGLFENIRANGQAIANLHIQTSKSLDGSVLPMLERLHSEIKSKTKEISNGAGKSATAVDKARNESQKHIELLGSHTGTFDAAGGKVSAHNDPYVVQRRIHHRLNKQVIEENNNRQDILTVQNNFQQFEAHVIAQVQAALNAFQQFMGSQADQHRAIYGDIAGTAANIPPDFEWNGFVKRNENLLVSPSGPQRSMSNITFPNQGHRATKPLIEGSLSRKSRAMGALKGYSSGYYAVTPAGYLHEFKDDDDFRKDPTPEVSLYLPDSTIGAVDGEAFTIKGKDSHGKMGLHMSSDFKFKAHTAADARMWHDIIAEKATGSASLPTSPVESRNVSGAQTLPPTTMEEKEAAQARDAGHVDTTDFGTGASPTSAGGQTSGVTRSGTNKSTAGQGSHFQTAPAKNDLEERKYVNR